MLGKGDSTNRQKKWTVASSSKLYSKICVDICLNTGKRFFLDVFSFSSILKPTEKAESRKNSFKKWYYGFLK